MLMESLLLEVFDLSDRSPQKKIINRYRTLEQIILMRNAKQSER